MTSSSGPPRRQSRGFVLRTHHLTSPLNPLDNQPSFYSLFQSHHSSTYCIYPAIFHTCPAFTTTLAYYYSSHPSKLQQVYPAMDLNTTTPTTAASIDETPLSASPERRSSLEKHLQHRPDVQDLKDRHILLDTNVAPYAALPPLPILPSIYTIRYLTKEDSSLQATRQELARQRTTDALKKHLEHRPVREELVERMFTFYILYTIYTSFRI